MRRDYRALKSSSTRLRSIAFVLAAAAASSSLGARASTPDGAGSFERDLFPHIGTDGFVSVVKALDGPGGRAVYVGGKFQSAGGINSSCVAVFDGVRFSSMADGVSGRGPHTTVSAFAAMTEGSRRVVYVGGRFRTAGGRSAENVARWDGSEFTPLGAGLETPGVVDLEVFDAGRGPELFAAGTIRNADGSRTSGVLRFDGVSWSVYTPNIDVVDLESFDDGSGPALHAAGTFVNGAGRTVRGVARCGDGAYVEVGEFDGEVERLAVFDDGVIRALYACGAFRNVSGVEAAFIARFDGRSWAAIPAGPNWTCRTMAVADDGRGPALFVGGYFTVAGGASSVRIARWDGAAWSPLGAGIPNALGSYTPYLESITSFDDGTGPAVIVAGGFPRAGNTRVQHVARWDAAGWSALPLGLDGPVNRWLAIEDALGSALVAGGSFERCGRTVLNGVARWTRETGFQSMGGGFPGPVAALAIHDDGSGPALIAASGTSITSASSIVSRYDGSAWTVLAGTFDGRVTALASFDDGSGPALFAGGWFWSVDGRSMRGVARWTGSIWERVGEGGPSFGISAMTVFDGLGGPALWVGGRFNASGPTLMRWDGGTWIGVRGGEVHALAAIGEELGGPALIAGGKDAGSQGRRAVARYDGLSWRDLEGGPLEGESPIVNALSVHDFGLGPRLYVAGAFDLAGDVPASGLAAWDGASWSAVMDGDASGIATLESVENSVGRSALFLGGDFSEIGGVVSSYAARLDDPCRACVAGTVNAGAGPIANVLFVNDSVGGPSRTLRLTPSDPVVLFMQAPPTATTAAAFALYGWRARPSIETVRRLPGGIGTSCLPMPRTEGSPRPRVVWNNTGLAVLGTPTLPSAAAPSIVFQLPNGVGRPASFFLQGIIEDPGSAGLRRASVTNGIRVEVR